MSLELILSAVLVAYGAFVLWKKSAVIPYGVRGFANPKPIIILRMNGKTAVIFALGLVIGGVVIGLGSGYQLLMGQALPDGLDEALPILGVVILIMGILGATLNGIQRWLNPENPADDTLHTPK